MTFHKFNYFRENKLQYEISAKIIINAASKICNPNTYFVKFPLKILLIYILFHSKTYPNMFYFCKKY